MTTPFLNHLQSVLSQRTNKNIQITACRQVFGGDINTTYILICNTEHYFIKLNDVAFADMLRQEQNGLLLLRSAKTSLKIPEPIVQGTYEQQSYLLMEYLEKGTANEILWQQLAIGLAQLHQKSENSFGLDYNNYIGTIPQSNTTAITWPLFYAEQRILPLVQKAYDKQQCTSGDIQLAEQFCSKINALIPEESPALLHGDLWSGNKMFTTTNEAALYDPAVYYGHREIDIAMTLLFGGFDTSFYNTYNEAYPLQNGWRNRVDICQLYPLLVHLILFGGRYYNSVKDILKKYA